MPNRDAWIYVGIGWSVAIFVAWLLQPNFLEALVLFFVPFLLGWLSQVIALFQHLARRR